MKFIFLIGLLLWCCYLCSAQEGKKRPYKPSQVVKIDTNKQLKITPGENGVPLPKTVRAGKPKVTLNSLKPILAGEPKVVKIDTSRLKKITPGKDGVPLPKKYIIPDSGYLVQYGDTIWAPKTATVRWPKAIPALPPSFKDNASFNIQYLDKEHGLPTNLVSFIHEDQAGYLWIGNADGVSRYDGSSLSTFTKKEGLSHNLVVTVYEDRIGNLWFGSEIGGVSRFDGNTITTFTTKEGLSHNAIISIVEDHSGALWFGSYGGGISRYDGNSITSFTEDQGLGSNKVWSISEDNNGNIWIATNGGGVSRYDGNSFTSFTETDGLNDNRVPAIMKDQNGHLWFGTFDGICKYDGDSFSSLTLDQGLSNNRIWRLKKDRNGNIWMGTIGGGVIRFDHKYLTNFSVQNGLSNNRVHGITQDSRGAIWFATEGGANRHNIFPHTTYSEVKEFKNVGVRSIIEDQHGNIWFGTGGSGVVRYDDISFASFNEEEGLSQKYINKIVETESGNLLFSTSDHGLNSYNGKSFTVFNEDQGLFNRTGTMMRDRTGNIWIAHLGDGKIKLYDGTSFTSFPFDGKPYNKITSILEGQNGNIWFGTIRSGVYLYDGQFLSNLTGDINKKYILSIYEDKDENLWFGTNEGLIVISKEDLDNENYVAYKIFTIDDGLPHNIVAAITQDNEGRLWIGTWGGLVVHHGSDKLNWESDDLQTYSKYDGIKNTDLISVYFDSKNRLWWGSYINGVSMMDLNKYEIPKGVPKVQLNGIDINGSFIDYRLLKDSLNQESNGSLSASSNGLKIGNIAPFTNYPETLSLPHDRNHLTFYFSAIEWEAPHKLQYQFMVEGVDENWSPLTKETKTDYRNLPYGDLTFKVRAVGASHKWSDTFEYPFTIRPPWYLTTWAKTLWISLFLGTFMAVYKLRTTSLKQQRRKLEQKVDEQTRELVDANEELRAAYDQLKELDEYKESMTGMIVHDFKNSLNTVINFSEGKPSERRMQSISQAGRFMLNMVMNILDVQKFEETSPKLSLGKYPLNGLIKEAVEQLTYLIEQKSLKLKVDQQAEVVVELDRDLIIRVITNILSNAIKFSPMNSIIAIAVKRAQEQVTISTRDQGPGIPEVMLGKVFNKYAQVEARKEGAAGSTGLGLTFCKMVVEAHEGTVGVESKEGKGSTFYFSLPVVDVQPTEAIGPIVQTMESTALSLSEDEKQQLAPYVKELQQWEVFDYSEVKIILDKIEPDGHNIEAWKEALIKALQNGNEEIFNKLIND